MKRSTLAAPLVASVVTTIILGCDRSPTTSAVFESGVIASKPGNGQGNGGGGFEPIPVTVESTGAFEVAAGQDIFITYEDPDLYTFAAMGNVITRTTHFDLTAAAARANNFADCASKLGTNRHTELSDTAKERLIGWLEGVTRSGGFNGNIDLTALGSPSTSTLNTQATDEPQNQHVSIGTFSLIENAEGPTVTQLGPDSFRFEGGIVQMWDRDPSAPKHSTLQCPNLDQVDVTITR